MSTLAKLTATLLLISWLTSGSTLAQSTPTACLDDGCEAGDSNSGSREALHRLLEKRRSAMSKAELSGARITPAPTRNRIRRAVAIVPVDVDPTSQIRRVQFEDVDIEAVEDELRKLLAEPEPPAGEPSQPQEEPNQPTQPNAVQPQEPNQPTQPNAVQPQEPNQPAQPNAVQPREPNQPAQPNAVPPREPNQPAQPNAVPPQEPNQPPAAQPTPIRRSRVQPPAVQPPAIRNPAARPPTVQSEPPSSLVPDTIAPKPSELPDVRETPSTITEETPAPPDVPDHNLDRVRDQFEGLIEADLDDDQTNDDDDEIDVETNVDESEPAPLPPSLGAGPRPQPSSNSASTNRQGGFEDFTLGRILGDENCPHPCEPYFCAQMWSCAGGKSQSWFDRAMRNLQRNYQVGRGHRGGPSIGGSVVGAYCPPGQRRLVGPALGSTCGVGIWRTRCAAPQLQSNRYGTVFGRGGCPTTGPLLSLGSRRCNRDCDDGNPWNLADTLVPDSGYTVTGWTQAGYHSRANDLFNSHPHRFNVHQSWWSLEKKAEAPPQGGIGWGVRADVMYGVDARDTQAFGGHPGSWDYLTGLDHGIYGWALPQAYGELAVGDWSVMVGHFFTIMGYEVVPAIDNFFYSHAMTMVNSEPFTHTGALATRSASDYVDFYFGWSLGWDTGFDQVNNGNSFLGGARLAMSDAFSVSYTTSFGDVGARGTGYAHSIVLAADPGEQWGYVFQNDVLRIHGEDNVGVNNYVFYRITDNIQLGTRVEWWKGDSITGYAPFGSTLPASGSHSYYAVTTGANFQLGTNVTIRPEGRVDWSPALNYSRGYFGVDAIARY